MTKYLLKRRNKWGQYIHLTTLDYEPTDEQIKSYFGPGEYSILIARKGIIGLAKVRDISIPWEIEYLEEVEGEPTVEYIQENYGSGNYFLLTNCRTTPIQVFPPDQPHDLTWQHLQDGANAMKRITIIYRVKMPWV